MGSSPGYDAIDDRRTWSDPDTGEGVTTYGTYRVQQRGAGANMSVDVGMDDFAIVRGDAVTHQALYKVPPHVTTINEAIGAAHATLPRVDQVVLQTYDSAHDGSGSNRAEVRVLAGTATAGATFDNRSGAAALPSSAIALADVFVAATDTAITNAEIRDRRAFCARGTVPPLASSGSTALDTVAFEPGAGLMAVADAKVDNAGIGLGGLNDGEQIAALVYLPRRIAAATKLRWTYKQGGTALTGTYTVGIMDASGRKIASVDSVAFTGSANSLQARSETIAATTFEAGCYYVVFGADTTNGGSVAFGGVLVANGGTRQGVTASGQATYDQSGTPAVTPSSLQLNNAHADVVAAGVVLGANTAVPLVSLSVG